MKQLFTFFSVIFILMGCRNETREDRNIEIDSEVSEASERVETETDSGPGEIDIDPVSHATAVFTWDDTVFYTDPVGGSEAFEGKPEPDFILITDIHGDHMDAETLRSLNLEQTTIVLPQAVRDELPNDLNAEFVVMENGDTAEVMGFEIEAVPMYNLPEDDPDSRHPKGRGNGYVLEKNDTRLYISGDTEDIPEMRNLQDIDVALVSMNMPYTMPVEQAAEGVLAFEPAQIYPYHYRGSDGLADVERFRELVNEENEDIEVVLANWYPEREEN